MPAFSRTTQKYVIVGGQVGAEVGFRVTVLEGKGGRKVRGSDADPKAPVERFEVWERVRAGTGHPARDSSPRQVGRGTGRERRGAPSRRSEHSSGNGVEVCATSTAGSRNT